MANTYNAEVVKYFRRKTSGGFNEPITYLGAEQRFVGALRNSSVNNLEEQFILGTDTYTEKYTDKNGNQVIETSYHINDSTHTLTDYYKIISVIYKDGSANEDFYFDNEIVKLPNNPSEVLFGDGTPAHPDLNEVYSEKDTVFIFENDKVKIYPSSFTVIRRDELHYISNGGDKDLLVLTKITGRNYLDDGAREVIRESIINHIAP